MVSRADPLGAATGVLLDRLVGEPPVSPHPVAVLGRALDAIERAVYRDHRVAGAVHAASGVVMGAGTGTVIGSTALATYVAVAGRGLSDAAMAVDTALAGGDIERARSLIPALVGRDPSTMDAKELCRAAVESVAENTVDAVVAPAFWGAVLGAPGALGYRAVNTMDSMVGHPSARYARYGWASARLDDVAGWLPARATAALVAAVRPRAAGAIWRTTRRDASHHPSPNAGVAETAFAAALGLRLGGENRYGDRVEVRPSLGDGRPPERHDIGRAVRLAGDVGLALTAGLGALGAVQRRRRRIGHR
ncbi:MAG: cobalamin biosynthesis protein CobD [Actinobacteria bacterium]|nr:MAG: cobalamin biosynthesis protein CobD [Actinomycetota bacterium]